MTVHFYFLPKQLKNIFKNILKFVMSSKVSSSSDFEQQYDHFVITQ